MGIERIEHDLMSRIIIEIRDAKLLSRVASSCKHMWQATKLAVYTIVGNNTSHVIRPVFHLAVHDSKRSHAIAVGNSHLVVLAEDGSPWSVGASEEGALGRGNGCTHSATFQRVLWAPCHGPLVAVGCGSSHALAVDSRGSLWTWGCSLEGQLGKPEESFGDLMEILEGGIHGEDEVEALQQHLEATVRPSLDRLLRGKVYTPGRVDLPGGHAVVSVAAGRNHSACITEDGLLWTFGAGSDGVLGHGDECNMEPRPRVVATLQAREEHVVRVSCGVAHTCAVTLRGALYSWGSSLHGRLGLGGLHGVVECTPSQVQLPCAVREVACGMMHTLVAGEDGTAWSFGGGSRGQLGQAATKELATPGQVMGVAKHYTRMVAAGEHQSTTHDAIHDEIISDCGSRNAGPAPPSHL